MGRSEKFWVVFQGVPMAVSCEYFPAHRGAREKGSGYQLEPDENAGVEVYAVFIGEADVLHLLSNEVLTGIEQLLVRNMAIGN